MGQVLLIGLLVLMGLFAFSVYNSSRKAKPSSKEDHSFEK